MTDINYLVSELVSYAARCGLITDEDRAYATSRLMERLKLSDMKICEIKDVRPVSEVLSDLCDYAYEQGIIAENGVDYRDIFDTALMGELTARPSEVISRFRSLYSASPREATDYFYDLAVSSNYIRADRVARDLKWTYDSAYGSLDITVNLSKPEKDPKAIAAAKLLPQTDYPKCPLCHENEGYAGSLSKAPRHNLRQIPFDMGGERWYLQYSPYVYYNEHCIALSEKHEPMKIDRQSFVKLLSFVTEFPHYFIGSNADLKIVGGSILSHDHMQGGRYTFAMERAEISTPLTFKDFPTVSAGIVRWPMSVIRLTGKDKGELVELADRILTAWRGYTDVDATVIAFSDGEPHNTITPIARRRGEDFELDLVLRNNLTTEEHPLGLYHPHAHRHNIKKENIGLIEVMGLAVLPSRLKVELAALKEKILAGIDPATDTLTEKHAEWLRSFADKYTFTEENTEDILRAEVGRTFAGVLEDAGVYKCTEEGTAAFLRFAFTVGGSIKE